MKQAQVQVGRVYAVKVSGRIQPVKITGTNRFGGWDGVNLAPGGRAVRIRTAARLRNVLEQVGDRWVPSKLCGPKAVAPEKPGMKYIAEAARSGKPITDSMLAQATHLNEQVALAGPQGNGAELRQQTDFVVLLYPPTGAPRVVDVPHMAPEIAALVPVQRFDAKDKAEAALQEFLNANPEYRTWRDGSLH